MTITNVAPILAGQGRRRRRRPPLTGDTLPFFSSPTCETPFSTASSHQYSSNRCRCRKSHGRRDTPPSTPVTTGRIADENPTVWIVSLLVSSPAREIRQIPELRRRTPRRSGLAFASLDHRERDCHRDAVTACREHYRREHVSLLKAPTRRRPLLSIFPFGFDQMWLIGENETGMGVLIRCGIGLQGWGCDSGFLLCVLFVGWGGVVMLRWCSTNGDWTRMLRDWNGEWVWGGSEDVNGGDLPVGAFLGLCFVFLYKWMIKMKVDEKKGKCSWNWWLAMMETDGWEVSEQNEWRCCFLSCREQKWEKAPFQWRRWRCWMKGSLMIFVVPLLCSFPTSRRGIRLKVDVASCSFLLQPSWP